MKINLVLCSITIFLCSMLLGDAFLIPAKTKSVTVSKQTSKRTSARFTSYINYFIFTSDNCKYEVSTYLYQELNVGDSVTIFTSRILQMPIALSYFESNKKQISRIGQLNTKTSERVLLLVFWLVSSCLLVFIYNKPFKPYGVTFALQIIPLFGTVMLFLTIMAEVILIHHSS